MQLIISPWLLKQAIKTAQLVNAESGIANIGIGANGMPDANATSWLAVPLKKKDGTSFGLIQVFNKNEGDFTPIDEKYLIQLAQYASITLERQQSHDQLRESEERFRVLANTIQKFNMDGRCRRFCVLVQ